MNLSEIEKSQIKHIVESPQWETVKRLADLFIQRIQSKSVIRDTQWETIKDTITKEAKVQGIREFIQELFNQTK